MKIWAKPALILVGLWVTSSLTRLGDLLDFGQVFKALATIDLPKSLTFLANFSNGVKIYHFSSAIIFGQLLLKYPPLTPFVKPRNVSNLLINDFCEYNLPYPQSAFTHNPALTHIFIAHSYTIDFCRVPNADGPSHHPTQSFNCDRK